jgi:hypothetical protein
VVVELASRQASAPGHCALLPVGDDDRRQSVGVSQNCLRSTFRFSQSNKDRQYGFRFFIVGKVDERSYRVAAGQRIDSRAKPLLLMTVVNFPAH